MHWINTFNLTTWQLPSQITYWKRIVCVSFHVCEYVCVCVIHCALLNSVFLMLFTLVVSEYGHLQIVDYWNWICFRKIMCTSLRDSCTSQQSSCKLPTPELILCLVLNKGSTSIILCYRTNAYYVYACVCVYARYLDLIAQCWGTGLLPI